MKNVSLPTALTETQGCALAKNVRTVQITALMENALLILDANVGTMGAVRRGSVNARKGTQETSAIYVLTTKRPFQPVFAANMTCCPSIFPSWRGKIETKWELTAGGSLV